MIQHHTLPIMSSVSCSSCSSSCVCSSPFLSSLLFAPFAQNIRFCISSGSSPSYCRMISCMFCSHAMCASCSFSSCFRLLILFCFCFSCSCFFRSVFSLGVSSSSLVVSSVVSPCGMHMSCIVFFFVFLFTLRRWFHVCRCVSCCGFSGQLRGFHFSLFSCFVVFQGVRAWGPGLHIVLDRMGMLFLFHVMVCICPCVLWLCVFLWMRKFFFVFGID